MIETDRELPGQLTEPADATTDDQTADIPDETPSEAASDEASDGMSEEMSDGTSDEASQTSEVEPAEPEAGGEPDWADGEPDPELPLALEPTRLRGALESILLVVDNPVPPLDLARAVQRPSAEVEAALRALAEEYDAAGRGIQLREIAGGWRMYTREEFAPYVERFVLDGQKARLSQAALETLAVIAYRQPVTRSRVSAIRGVGVDGVIRTLLTRGLIVEDGTDGETGGGLYRTTTVFLERIGLNSLAELPPLAPLLPDVGPNADERLDADTAEALADLVGDPDADDRA